MLEGDLLLIKLKQEELRRAVQEREKQARLLIYLSESAVKMEATNGQ